jgi:hypothetical protein
MHMKPQRQSVTPPASKKIMHRPIIYMDCNTIWHRRLAEAMAEQRELVAISPQSVLKLFEQSPSSQEPQWNKLLYTAPGWASRTASFGQRQIAAKVRRIASRMSISPIIILTSPKYSLLAKILDRRFPVLYYCADDYREYVGWGGESVAQEEGELIKIADYCIFVSEALRRRAVLENSLKEDKTMVSPNATEPRFAAKRGVPLPSQLENARRPIFGVLGGLSHRLDISLLAEIASITAVGTLVIVGPIDNQAKAAAVELCANAKVRITGQVPHTEMHNYARALDAAVIPYTKTPINFYCSPMRLYDHLASGSTIYATDACDQINQMTDQQLVVASASNLPAVIAKRIETNTSRNGEEENRKIFWSDRATALLEAADRL